MRKLLTLVACVLAGAACSTNPKPKPPEPPPQPQCAEGQATCCWHQPPGNQWLYACPAPNVEGGVLNVAGGPAQCPNDSCGTPTPEPTPEPTPPPSGTVPPKGEPQGAERLTRVHDDLLYDNATPPKRVKPFMAVPCCEAWAKCPNQGWPNASACFMDETHKYGADAWHFRLGPWYGDAEHESEWAEVGGPYKAGSLEWNDAYWSKVRELAWHAYQLGGYVEVVPIDSWYIKVCRQDSSQCPWPEAEVQAAGRTPAPEAERLLRKAVQELGCWGNITWVTGNEEDLVPGMSVSWLNWVVSVLRDEEQKSGCGFVHMIGTGSYQDGIAADFSVTHETAPVTGPCRGRWCENNEHNPAWSPEKEASYFAQAYEAGQSWAAWRADADDAAWEKRLRLIKEYLGGSAGVGCYPPPDNDKWVVTSRNTSRADEVRAAEAQVGNMCKEPKLHQNGIDAIAALCEQLRKNGLCAGTVGALDACFVLEEDGKTWGEYHAVAPFDTGCWSTSNAHYPLNSFNYTGQWTPPAPPANECPVPVPFVDEVLCKLHQPNQGLWDCTPKAHGQPILPEGDPSREACEKAAMGGGYPTYRLSDAPPSLTLEEAGNPMQFHIRGSGSGVVTCVTPSSGGKNVCKAGDTTVEQGVPVSR